MPNWCENKATIVCPTVDDATRLVEALQERRMLASLVPMPPEVAKDPRPDVLGDAEYEWRSDNWGVKWDVNGSATQDGRSVDISFDSPWCPPLEWYGAIENLGYKVDALYNESGMAFCGAYANGEDTYVDYPKTATRDAYNKRLPAAILEAFSFDWLDDEDK